MTDDKSQESLFVMGIGQVTIRGLTVNESAALYVMARKKSLGNQKAMKWILLIGTLCIGVVAPKMSKDKAEDLIKRNAKDASRLAIRIVELTHDQTGSGGLIGNG